MLGFTSTYQDLFFLIEFIINIHTNSIESVLTREGRFTFKFILRWSYLFLHFKSFFFYF